MKKFNIIESYLVTRELPKNYNADHESLFSIEFEKTFKKVDGFSDTKSWIDSGGIIANLLMWIQLPSLVNLRAEENLKFLLSHYPRLILKFPRLKWKDYLWISERWSHGYFHWFCDALPRYFILNDDLKRNKILLPMHYSNYKYIPESLEYLGLEYEYIPKGTKYLTNSIAFSQPVCNTGNFYPPVMKTIRSAFQSKSAAVGELKRYYISRKYAKVRRIINEDECEIIFKANGFNTIYLEKMVFTDQMVLLANADVLMGVHGAGLTNMIACPDNCKIIEIRGETDNTNNCFYALASALDLDYYYLLAKENPTQNDKVGDVHLNINQLSAFLSKYFPT